MIGKEGDGFKIAMAGLDGGRVNIGMELYFLVVVLLLLLLLLLLLFEDPLSHLSFLFFFQLLAVLEEPMLASKLPETTQR